MVLAWEMGRCPSGLGVQLRCSLLLTVRGVLGEPLPWARWRRGACGDLTEETAEWEADSRSRLVSATVVVTASVFGLIAWVAWPTEHPEADLGDLSVWIGAIAAAVALIGLTVTAVLAARAYRVESGRDEWATGGRGDRCVEGCGVTCVGLPLPAGESDCWEGRESKAVVPLI